MSGDIKEMEDKIKEIRTAIKEAKITKNAVLGEGIEKAVKAGHLSWSDLRSALDKVVKKKKDRKLLKLPEVQAEKPAPPVQPVQPPPLHRS
mgnify:CR=1 FL=1